MTVPASSCSSARSSPRWRSTRQGLGAMGPAGGSAFGSTRLPHIRVGRRIEVSGRRWPGERVVTLRQGRPALVGGPRWGGTAGRRVGQRLVSGWQLRRRTGPRWGRGRCGDLAGLHCAGVVVRVLGHVARHPAGSPAAPACCPARTAGWRSPGTGGAPIGGGAGAATGSRAGVYHHGLALGGRFARHRRRQRRRTAVRLPGSQWSSAPKPITTPASAIFATCRSEEMCPLICGVCASC